jgi:hypothetical protein
MAFGCLSSVVMAATTAFLLAGCAVKEGAVKEGAVKEGSLIASWIPPTTNVDGSPVTDLTSYRIYVSIEGSPCPDGRFVTIDAATGVSRAPDQRVAMTLSNLTVGQVYYVAVTAVNSLGGSGPCSNTESARARRRN